MKKEIIYKLISLTFQALLINYFIFLILDSLTKGFVSYYFDLKMYLWILIVIGFIYIVYRKVDIDKCLL